MAGRHTAHRTARICLLLAIALTLVGPAPAHAIEPPPELHFICVDAQNDVIYAARPADCTSRERVRTLPDDRPLRWCADQLGRLKEAEGTQPCSARERSLTVPADGPILVCARNVQGGTTLARGDLRVVVDLSDCDRDETGLVTPAAPEGVADAYTVDEDIVLVASDKGVLDNDRDLTGAPLTARLISRPQQGELALQEDGGFRFDPRGAFDFLDAGESATTTFVYVADDGKLESESTTVTMVVTGRNDRPVAHPDVVSMDEDTVHQLAAPGVLGNDTDGEAHPLTAELVQGPDQGELSLQPDGGFRFDPRSDFQHLGAFEGDQATTSFRYVARDGTAASDAATVTVTVLGVNDSPVGRRDHFSTDENTPLEISPRQLLGNDTDAEGQPLAVTDVVFPGPGMGTFATLPDGTMRFDPGSDSGDPDSEGDFDHLRSGGTATVELTYRADDGAHLSDQVTVSIAVRGISPPNASDHVATTDEDHPVALDLFDGSEVEGGALTLDDTATGGAVEQEAGGVVSYDPAEAFQHLAGGGAADDTFRYTLTNDEGSSTGSVTVRVNGLNDAPVAVPDRYEDLEPDQVVTVPAPGILRNDGDVDDGAALTARLVAPPELGRVTLQPEGGFTFDPAGEVTNDTTLTFRYRADDGATESATATVSLVLSKNIPPVIEPDQFFRTTLDAPRDAVVGRVQAKDPDGDAATLTYAMSNRAPFRIDADSGRILVDTDTLTEGTFALQVVVTDARGASVTESVTVDVVSPLTPGDDLYDTIGNTPLAVGDAEAPGIAVMRAPASLLANDGTPSQPGETITVTPVTDETTTLGGQVSIDADGSFVYVPPRPDPTSSADGDPCYRPGDPAPADRWDGSVPAQDTFTYQLVRSYADGSQETRNANVTLRISDVVWYVDGNRDSTGDGCGTSSDPYATLAPLSGVDDDSANQTIFVRGSDAGDGGSLLYTDAVILESGQRLVGEGAGLTRLGQQLVAAGSAPVLAAGEALPGVTVVDDNHIRGLDIDTLGPGIVGSGVGDLQVDVSAVRAGAGPALDLAGPGTVEVTVGYAVGSDAATPTVDLTGLGGSVAITAISAAAPDTDAAREVLAVSENHAAIDVGAVEGGARPGAHLRQNEGSIAIGTLTSDASTAALHVIGNGEDGIVDVGELDATDPDPSTAPDLEAGIRLVDNQGKITVGTATIAGTTGHAVSTTGNTGSVRIFAGTISGDPGRIDTPLVESQGGAGRFRIDAALRVAPAEGSSAPTPTDSHVVLVDGLGQSGIVTFGAQVVGRGAAVEIVNGSATSLVRFARSLDIETQGVPAFLATGGRLEADGTGSTLASRDAPALRLVDVTVGAFGASFGSVSSTDARLVTGSETLTGYGIDLVGIDRDSASTSRLVIGGGTLDSSAVGGVRVQSADHVTLQGLTIVTPGDTGLDLRRTEDVVLTGVTVDRAGSAGLLSHDDQDLLVDGSAILGSGSHGVHLAAVTGRVTLSGMRVQGSRATQVRVDDAGTLPGATDTVVLDATTVSDGVDEVGNIVVAAREDAALALQSAGSAPSGSFQGRVGLHALAVDGGRLSVDLSRFATALTAGDGIVLESRGQQTDSAGAPLEPPQPSRLDFTLTDLNDVGGGGVSQTAGAGIRVLGDGVGQIGGTTLRVDVADTGAEGVVVDHADRVTLASLDVTGTVGAGVAVRDSSDVDLFRVEVANEPTVTGIELWNVHDVRLRDSRVDLRSQVPPEDESSPALVDDVAQWCTTPERAAANPWTIPPAPARVADGVAGVLARHVSGTLEITDTVVRGGTLHQVVVVNGPQFPTFLDPAPRSMPTENGGTVVLEGLTLLDTPDLRAALLAGAAGAEGAMNLDLTGSGTPNTTTADATLLFCASGGADLTVAGGHPIRYLGSDDALVMKSAGYTEGPVQPSTLTYALDGLGVEFVPAPGETPRDGIVTRSEDGGVIDGTIRNLKIRNAPGAGYQVSGEHGTVIDGLTVESSAGPALEIHDSSNVQVLNLTASDTGGEGLRAEDVDGLVVSVADIDNAGAAGVDVRRSTRVSLLDVDVTRPATYGIDLLDVRDLTVADGVLEFSPPNDAETGDEGPGTPFAGLRGRHVDGQVQIDGETLTGFSDHQILLANGSSFSGVDTGPGTDVAATVRLSGLTLDDTTPGKHGVLVGSGPGADVRVDLTGEVTTTDAGLRVASGGGALAVTGGHPLVNHGGGDALVVDADAAPASLVDLTGMTVIFNPTPDAPAAPGNGIVVTGSDTTVLTDTAVTGAGDGIVVTGSDTATLLRPILDGIAGTGIAGVDNATTEITAATIRDGGGPGIFLTGGLEAVVQASTVATEGVGIVVDGDGAVNGPCVDLVGNDATAAVLGGFELTSVGLRALNSSTGVENWLSDKDNKGSVWFDDVKSC